MEDFREMTGSQCPRVQLGCTGKVMLPLVRSELWPCLNSRTSAQGWCWNPPKPVTLDEFNTIPRIDAQWLVSSWLPWWMWVCHGSLHLHHAPLNSPHEKSLFCSSKVQLNGIPFICLIILPDLPFNILGWFYWCSFIFGSIYFCSVPPTIMLLELDCLI